MRETWVLSLGWEDPLEKGKATHLENSMDCIINGVAKSRTQLSVNTVHTLYTVSKSFPGGAEVKNLPAMQET